MADDPENLHRGGFNAYTQDPAGIPSASSQFLRYAISLDFQPMSTDGLISWPMTLKLCTEVGLIFIHRTPLAFLPPVPRFCAMPFLLIFN